MDQDRPLHLPDILECLNQIVQTMAIDGPDIFEAQLLKEESRHQKTLQGFLRLFGKPGNRLSDSGKGFKKGHHLVPEPIDKLPGHESVEVGGEGAHIRGNRHLIIIQDHDQIPIDMARLIEAFKGKACGHRPVSDDGDDLSSFVLVPEGFSHSKGRRDGCPAVARIEGIVRTLLPLRKPADPSVLPQGMKTILSSRQELMGITLMPHVPDQLVPRKIEDIMQGKGQLHDPQIGGKMPPVFGYGGNDLFPNLAAEASHLLDVKFLNIK